MVNQKSQNKYPKETSSSKEIENDFYNTFFELCNIYMFKEFLSTKEDSEGLVQEIIEFWEQSIEKKISELKSKDGEGNVGLDNYKSYLMFCRENVKKKILEILQK